MLRCISETPDPIDFLIHHAVTQISSKLFQIINPKSPCALLAEHHELLEKDSQQRMPTLTQIGQLSGPALQLELISLEKLEPF